MSRLRLKVTTNLFGAAVKAVRKLKVSMGDNVLSFLPAELQFGIFHHLPRTSLPTIYLPAQQALAQCRHG